MIFNNYLSRIFSLMNTIQKTIGTHSGSFHMDEVLGITMLTKYTQEFKDAKVVRTRDENILNTLDLVLDVGRIYDPSKLRFDHHQKEFTGTFNENYSIKLSSAGLIYKHYGKEVIKNVAEELIKFYNVELTIDEKSLDEVYYRIYDNFILYVDAVDNGVEALPKDIKPKYKMCGHLAQRVARLNPSSFDKASFDERFFEAIKVCDEELRAQVKDTVLGWLRGKKLLEQSIEKRFEVHSSGQIIKLQEAFPWKSSIFELEEQFNCVGEIKFVLFADEAGGEGWRVQAVPINPNSFISRKLLRSDWRGIAINELREKSGLPDAVFCHVNGFIGGARSYESAYKMAALSLEAPDDEATGETTTKEGNKMTIEDKKE